MESEATMSLVQSIQRIMPRDSNNSGSAHGARRPSRGFPIRVEGLEERALLSNGLTQFPIHAPAGDGNDQLQAISAGPGRSVWFLDADWPEWFIGRIAPSGKVEWFPGIKDPGIQAGNYGPFLLTEGPDAKMWFSTTSDIGKITPRGAITLYPAPAIVSSLSGLTAGPDGNVWFTSGNLVGRITPTGQITTFPIVSGSLGSQVVTGAIAEGSDGRVWFAALIPSQSPNGIGGLEVGAVTPAGQITLYPIEQAQQAGGGMGGEVGFDLTRGPDGDVWLAVDDLWGDFPKPAIFRIDPSGHVKRFSIPLPSDLLLGAIASGPKDKVYYGVTDNNIDVGPNPQPILGALSPSGKVSFKSVPRSLTPGYFWGAAPPLTVGPGGSLWYLSGGENGEGATGQQAIGRVSR